jgi:hypothetical protein
MARADHARAGLTVRCAIYTRKSSDEGLDHEQLADRRTRAGAPFSHSVVLSMPAGTDPIVLRDAVRSFAADTFAGRHDYVFTLHTETPRPTFTCPSVHAATRGSASIRARPTWSFGDRPSPRRYATVASKPRPRPVGRGA